MVTTCCAVNCSTSNRCENYKKGIAKLHRVPKDVARRRQWAVAIRRKADDGGLWVPEYGAALCSLHFTDGDMDRTGQTVRLREGATPSRFNYSEPDPRKRKVLLSQEELNAVLDEHRRLNSSWIIEPPQETTLPQPPEPSGPPIRASIRVRKLSAKCSLLAQTPGENVSAQATHGLRSKRSRAMMVPSSQESDDPQQNIRTADDPVDPRDAGVSAPEVPPPLTVPEPLNLPFGLLTRHMSVMRSKQHRLQHLQKTCSNLLDKIEFRKTRRNWSEKTDKPSPSAPLLMLRHDRTDNDPTSEPMHTLSQETLLPLTPNEAWKTIAALREQVLDLRLSLMSCRVQVLDGELQLEEARAGHNRLKADMKEEVKQTQKAQRANVREAEKRRDIRCLLCPKLKKRLQLTKRDTNKKLRRAENLAKRLEKTFTPMQMRVFRTGKKPRWAEEDIRRAIELKMYVSHRGYSYIRQNLGVPLPTTFILSRGVARYKTLQPLYDKMLIKNKKNLRKSKTEKSSHSPSAKKRRLADASVVTSSGLLMTELPLKRQKKRPLARSLQRQPSCHDGGSVGEGGNMDMVLAACDWEVDNEHSLDDETLELLTRPRETYDRRGWKSTAPPSRLR